jgi:hypothetical protein
VRLETGVLYERMRGEASNSHLLSGTWPALFSLIESSERGVGIQGTLGGRRRGWLNRWLAHAKKRLWIECH